MCFLQKLVYSYRPAPALLSTRAWANGESLRCAGADACEASQSSFVLRPLGPHLLRLDTRVRLCAQMS